MARKKTAKKAATKAAKKTTRKKTVTRKTVARKTPTVTPSARGPGGESALTGQGPSWWKPGMPVDPGFRREIQDDRPKRSSPPSIPVGIYPQTQRPAEAPAAPEPAAQPWADAGLELFGDELEELKSEHLPADMIPLDDELTTDVDDLLNGEYEAVDSLLDGSLEDQLSDVVAEVVAEVVPEVPEDALDDDLDATEYSPPDLEDILEVPQDVLDIVEKEMPVYDDSASADPADFVEPDAVEEPPAPLVAEEPPVEEPPVEEPPAEEPPAAPVETTVAEQDTPAEPEPAPSPAGDPLIVTVLRRLNYPLRVLPPSSRMVVDWVAWSLILWVPVVWAIAIVVVGR